MLIIGYWNAIVRLQGPTIRLLLNASSFGRDVRFYSEYKPFGQTLRELWREVTRNDAWLFVNGPANAVTAQFTHDGEPVMLNFLLHGATDSIDRLSGLCCQDAFI
jgi:hypothetical protein